MKKNLKGLKKHYLFFITAKPLKNLNVSYPYGESTNFSLFRILIQYQYQ